MLFDQFSRSLLELETTASRLSMTELLAQLFAKLDESEVQQACYLLQGKLVPLYQSLEFQMSVKMVLRALARIQGSNDGGGGGLFDDADNDHALTQVTKIYKQKGDIGLVAEELVSKQLEKAGNANAHSKSTLSILDVFSRLETIAKLSGVGSQEQKVTQLEALIKELDPVSARYVARIVVGKLRLGFSTMTMLDSLSWAVVGDKSESEQLELIYQKRADVGTLAKVYLSQRSVSSEERLKLLDNQIKVTIGIPIVPALCQRLNSSEEIIAKMHEIIVEPKYDGLRVQIHLDAKAAEGEKIQVFTRNLENVTHMFPELQDIFSKLNASACIVDGEAIGYNKETGKLLPFQETITRRRKHDIGEKAASVPIRFYIFDLIKVENNVLLEQPLRARKELLKSLFKDNEVFLHAPYIITDSAEKTRTEHTRFLAEGLEGAVMKQLDSHYVGGRKGWNWVKIKEAEGTTGKLSDTLDCVVMGYYVGRGKRSAFGMGALLVGVLDQQQQQVLTIAKIGTGLSDEQLATIKKQCDQYAVAEQPPTYVVDKNLVPDVWVEPAIVLEIAADELTHSPIHTAELALRFPRLIRVRDDKSWEQATTLGEVKQITIA